MTTQPLARLVPRRLVSVYRALFASIAAAIASPTLAQESMNTAVYIEDQGTTLFTDEVSADLESAAYSISNAQAKKATAEYEAEREAAYEDRAIAEYESRQGANEYWAGRDAWNCYREATR